jgi:hypothetical protein
MGNPKNVRIGNFPIRALAGVCYEAKDDLQVHGFRDSCTSKVNWNAISLFADRVLAREFVAFRKVLYGRLGYTLYTVRIDKGEATSQDLSDLNASFSD